MKTSPSSSSPPSLVALAVLLIGATFAIGLVKWAYLSNWGSPISNVLLLVAGTLALVWVLYAIRNGSNLWRWLFALLFIGGVVSAVVQPPAFAHAWESLFFWAQALVQLAASAMLFLPESSRWFSRERNPVPASIQSKQP